MNTLKFGNGEWYGKKDTILAYNDENSNFKPLPFSFDRASSATRVNKDGLIETVGSGEPRIDYKDDSNGALLLEPTRTNLITYSEDFTHPNWNKESGVIITPNYGISPDGTQNSTRLQLNSINKSIYFVTGLGYASLFSIYIKGTKGEVIRVSNTGGTLHTFTGEWDRVECYDSGGTSPNVSVNSYGGSTTALDMEIWGAQLEAGSYATSYIPTQGAIAGVTRVAETCSGAGNEQVFNDSEGVLFAEISALANDLNIEGISVSDGSSSNRVVIFKWNISNTIRARVTSGGVNTFDFYVSVSDITNINKIALKYKQNDFALWINGIEVATDFIGAAPIGLSKLNFDSDGIGSAPLYGNTKQIQYFDTALNDSDLETLTSWDSFSDMANGQLYTIE